MSLSKSKRDESSSRSARVRIHLRHSEVQQACAWIGRVELGHDLHDLLNRDVLYPLLHLLRALIHEKLGFPVSTEESYGADVLLLDEFIATHDTETAFPNSEFPPDEWVTVSCSRFGRDIDIETREVETYGLTNGFDVGIFDGDEGTQASEYDVVA